MTSAAIAREASHQVTPYGGVARRPVAVFASRAMYLFSHRIYRRALQVPLRTAHGWWREREGIIVRLTDSEGRVGFGEIAPITDFGTEMLAEADALCASFGERVPAERLDSVPGRFGCVRFALSEARRELAGRPTQRGRSEPLPVAGLLPAGKAVRAALAERIEGGYLCVKWKVGVEDADAELGLLDELVAELPSYVKLRLDANGAWNRRQAARWLDRCAERPVEFVEQPLPPADRDGLRGLAADFPVKLALDESVVRLNEAERWQSEGWPGVFVIKPALCGPLDELRDWAVRTKADVVLSSAIETSIGRAAILTFLQRHAGQLTKRAIGFGTGEIFGDRVWDGAPTGPLLDATWTNTVDPEALWNELN